jgi:hypothetical protein
VSFAGNKIVDVLFFFGNFSAVGMYHHHHNYQQQQQHYNP